MKIRPLVLSEMPLVVDYFLNATPEYLAVMGVDPEKLPTREGWLALMESDFTKPDDQKAFCFVGWLDQGQLVGHSSINKIAFGQEAWIHLHLWQSQNRQKGLGLECFKASMAYFAERFQLKKLVCEPKADNMAPNKVLEKVGFNFIKQYQTVPGWINFEQTVNRWEMTVQ